MSQTNIVALQPEEMVHTVWDSSFTKRAKGWSWACRAGSTIQREYRR